MRIISPLLCLFLIVSACQKPQETPEAKVDLNFKTEFDSVVDLAYNQDKVLGMSVAIMQGNDTLYRSVRGYSDSAKSRTIKLEDRFLMASISKLVGATVIMRLAELNYLSLDQTLDNLLPDFPNPQQAAKITMRHLISHTSGLQDYASEIDSVWVRTGVAPTKQDFYKFFAEKPLLFDPGEAYSYCNSGFLLMAMVAERLTGQSWQTLVDLHINEAGSFDMKLIAETHNNPEMVPYFELQAQRFEPKPHWPWIKGDGGLTINPTALAHFPSYWAHEQIISDSSFKAMVTPGRLNNGMLTGYGLGVRTGNIQGEPIIGHTGGHKSNYAVMMYLPATDITIVVCTNTDNTPLQARNVAGQLAMVALNKPYPDFSHINEPLDNIKSFEGTYHYPGYKTTGYIDIVYNQEDGFLYYQLGPDRAVKMHHLGNLEFWIERWPLDRIVFARNPEGAVLGLKEYYQGFYVILRKKVDASHDRQ